MSTQVCSIEGCERPRGRARGWCSMHYRRWQNSGTPLGVQRLRPPVGSTPEQAFSWYRPGEPPTDGSCWDWQGTVDSDGYGQLGSRRMKAHRVSYEIYVGTIPSGAGILHRCDRPICVNPYHLRPGTQRENVDDAVSRDRVRKGERHGMAKLTEAQVIEIRRLRRAGQSSDELSRMFGIGSRTVRSIVNRETWRHVPEEETK